MSRFLSFLSRRAERKRGVPRFVAIDKQREYSRYYREQPRYRSRGGVDRNSRVSWIPRGCRCPPAGIYTRHADSFKSTCAKIREYVYVHIKKKKRRFFRCIFCLDAPPLARAPRRRQATIYF